MLDQIKNGKLVALAVMLVGGTVGAAHADSFEVVNLHHSASIVQAWFAPNGMPDVPWKTITMYRPIEPRSTSSFSLTKNTTCTYDFRLRFNDGYLQTVGNVDLCNNPYVVAN